MAPRKPVRPISEPKKETKTIPLAVDSTPKKKTNRTSESRQQGPGFGKQLVSFFRNENLHVIAGILILMVSFYMSIAMVSYFFTGAEDQSKMEMSFGELHGARDEIRNVSSFVGALVSHKLIHQGFGIGAFAIPFYLFVIGMRFFRQRIFSLWKSFLHSFFWMTWLSLLLGMADTYFTPGIFFLLGGAHGVAVSTLIISYIGEMGILMSLTGAMLIYSIIANSRTVPFLKNLFSKKQELPPVLIDDDEETEPLVAVGTEIIPDEWIRGSENNPIDLESLEDEKKPEDSTEEYDDDEDEQDDDDFEVHLGGDSDELQDAEVKKKEEARYRQEENQDPNYNIDKLGKYDPTLDLSHYTPPTLQLLKVYGTDNETQIDMSEQKANKERITTTLQNYGIEIKTIKATVGPTITLYEIVPKEGVRISKIKNLEYDIMLSLAATGIRIIAPIPGKGTIGIEVPNADPQIVSMHSVIASRRFQDSKFDLPVAFGRTITNEVFMVDLTKMPHLLVAGATGQGKSVGLNAIITSLLYKKHPAELKLVLIDPKKVEFNIYGGIERHFLAKLPDGEDAIITDTTKVVETLNSICKEMDDRYDLLKKAHVRNIKEYNEKFVNRQLNPEKGHRFLPYIVVIVDEFGDLIMTAGKEVELPIARIAQLARATGIHMIIATQRPSVNIITGVIKANFPARVAFRVSSMIDSRTIIDGPGANQLVGRGDMLFTSGNELIRVQCAFVDTPEVENIVQFIGVQQSFPTAFYLPEYVGPEGEGADLSQVDMSKRDPLFEEAARLIVSSQQGSTSNIQRKFSIGYNRAGRIVDQLEVAGIIGPNEGSKARQVLVMDDHHLDLILKQLR
jgi:S-DNA-T family DNA segregation ATPase FtsK/SpoIIIE